MFTISKMAAVVAMGLVLSAVALADDASPNTPNAPGKGKVSKMDTQAQGQMQTQSQTQVKGDYKADYKGGDTQISKGSGSPVAVKGDKGQVQGQAQAQTQTQSQTQTPIVEKGKDQAAYKVSKDKGGEPVVNNKASKFDKPSKKSDKPSDN